MKNTLEFNLPEEKEELQLALKSGALKCAIDEIFNNVLRSRIKYGLNEEDSKLSNEELLEKVRTEMYEILEDYCPGMF